MSEPKIVRAVITFLETEQDMAAVFTNTGGRAVVTATFGDGHESEMLRYYANELTFTAEEFVGR